MKLSFALVLICLPGFLRAEEALVAVATNFTMIAEELVTAFEAAHPHSVRIASGSTGKLYAQILNGAPFDALLAADELRPQLLEASDYGVAGSRFTYATGRLVLWSADKSMLLADFVTSLLQPRLRHIAMANPDLAPYGLAAQETLESLGLIEKLADRIVLGENVGQTYALVATGNAQAGFVAMSYVRSERQRRGAYLEVPAELHSPLHQDALLLRHGVDNAAATAFLDFLQSESVRTMLQDRGYE